MKRKLAAGYLVAILLPILLGCKSAEKSFKEGDFDDSVLRAAVKLKSYPTHAASLDVLRQAYPLALDQHLNEIEAKKHSEDLFRWEALLETYLKLNRLFKEINSCEACITIVTPKGFEKEEKLARHNAASVRYKEGTNFLSIGDRTNARQAYQHFEKVEALIPDFNDNKKKLEIAYELASFKVIVEQVLVNSGKYQLSNAYFQERVNEFLQTSGRLNKFVRFYMPEEAVKNRIRPDQVISLQFDDFVVGQTMIVKTTETFISKDTVKTGEKVVGRTRVPVYGKVSAKLTEVRKTVLSAGLLNMRITDFNTRQTANEEKFNGEYNWTCEWASFTGDERALTSAQLRKCKSQELFPPPPQQLFIEFSKPIYERLTSKLQSFYAKY
ncbi:hypothetical protein [Dyadobacter aurulentus]|uniref:hypothetical protein n=1 Tax=Dyadobacter sp. UC 10 TaxID=2605428 RepID=UPI0011F1CB88|nr:hypothetical protein [Dyadobacter sp. UC 10]KAA0989680.1 hypothetical protein FXO21_05630 [Dyadobacter sp. UC 10]